MKKIKFFCLFLLLLLPQLLLAEGATAILDKAAARFKAAGDVKIGFQVSTEAGSTTGYIDIAGNKFHCDMGGTRVWFDGTTLWNYVKANEEVNVTTPSEAETARLNPYSFITMYKKGYSCKNGKSTKAYHEVIMTGSKNTAYKSVVVRLDKKNYQPLYVKTTTAKHTTEVTVNSYLTNQKFPATRFSFSKKEFPKAEVVDLR